jgi:hypothetical protein
MNSMLFEGSNLEEVLNEARLCFGSDVEIESANRVRRGGMLGFFASEWFEVWARPSSDVAANPALALLDDENDADTFQSMVRNAMADRRIRSDQGLEPSLREYDAALDDFFGGGEAAPARELVGAGAAMVSDNAALAAAMIPAAVTTAAATPHAVASMAPGNAPLTAAMPPTVQPTPSATQVTASPMTSAAVALEDAPRGASVFSEQQAPKSDLLWAMLERLEQIPTAPALPTTGLVVFVGQAKAAWDAARAMGERHALWNGDVAVVSRSPHLEDVPAWLVVNDLDDLASRAGRWRQRGIVPIVLDLGTEAVDQVWAIRAITQLQADQVRLVAEAWRLTEDVGRTAGKLGGVDAIELVAVADTVEPLAMLDLEIPISTVEGRTATPDLLAAIWLENRRRG